MNIYADLSKNINEEILTTLQEFKVFFDAMKPVKEKNGEQLTWFTNIPDPNFNVVMHLEKENDLELDFLINQAPYGNLSFWIHDLNESKNLIKALRRRRFKSVAICPLMKWSVQPVELTNYEVKLADPEIFHKIVAEVFHFEGSVEEEYARLLKNGKAENYLVYFEGNPVGTGTLICKRKKGCIFNITTLSKYQKKGCAKAMMKFLMHRSEVMGLDKVILLSTPVAEKLYSDLGFTKCFDIEIYVH